MADKPDHRTSESAAAVEDTVYVRNLRLAAVFERDAWGRPSKTQPVIICLQLQLDTSKTGSSDDILHSFSYGQICKDLTLAVDAKTFVDIDRLTNALCEAARPWPGQKINGQILLPKAFLRVDGGFRKHFARLKLPDGDWEVLENRWVVEGIKAACIIGINAHERLEKQTVNVDLTVSWTRLAQESGPRSSSRLLMEQWQALVKTVLENVEVSTFETLEALASLLARCCLDFVPHITVSVEKPSALGMVEASGVTISRTRENAAPI